MFNTHHHLQKSFLNQNQVGKISNLFRFEIAKTRMQFGSTNLRV